MEQNVDQNDQATKKPETSDDDTEGQKFSPTGAASRTGVTPSDDDDDTEGHKMSRT